MRVKIIQSPNGFKYILKTSTSTIISKEYFTRGLAISSANYKMNEIKLLSHLETSRGI